MEGNTKAVAFQGAGQPPENASSQQVEQTQGNATQPEYVTVEDARRFAKEAAEEALRRAQSFFDINQNAFGKRIQDQLAQLEKAWSIQAEAGLEVPDEAAKDRIRQKAIQKELTKSDSPPTAETPFAQVEGSRQKEVTDPYVAAINKLCNDMERKAGVILEANDPEIQGLDRIQDGDDYVLAFRQALDAKKQRLASAQPNQPPARIPTNLGAGGSHNPNPIAHINNIDELYKMSIKK
jgi:hypothetical protein